jgi:hypothetical protein
MSWDCQSRNLHKRLRFEYQHRYSAPRNASFNSMNTSVANGLNGVNYANESSQNYQDDQDDSNDEDDEDDEDDQSNQSNCDQFNHCNPDQYNQNDAEHSDSSYCVEKSDHTNEDSKNDSISFNSTNSSEYSDSDAMMTIQDFNNLPDVIIAHIGKFLKTCDLVCCASILNKQWHNVIFTSNTGLYLWSTRHIKIRSPYLFSLWTKSARFYAKQLLYYDTENINDEFVNEFDGHHFNFNDSLLLTQSKLVASKMALKRLSLCPKLTIYSLHAFDDELYHRFVNIWSWVLDCDLYWPHFTSLRVLTIRLHSKHVLSNQVISKFCCQLASLNSTGQLEALSLGHLSLSAQDLSTLAPLNKTLKSLELYIN